MMDNLPENCEVCEEPMSAEDNASCAFCHRVFHLTWDTRREIKDCGRFDLDEESLAMYFTCNLCSADMPPPPSAMPFGAPGMPPPPG